MSQGPINPTWEQCTEPHSDMTPGNCAILFTMFIGSNPKDKMYNDVLNYYINELKIPKDNVFIVDSGNRWWNSKLLHNDHSLVYEQDYIDRLGKLEYKVDKIEYITKGELLSIKLSNKFFDFSKFDYVFKVTGKYKIPSLKNLLYYRTPVPRAIYSAEDYVFSSTKMHNHICGPDLILQSVMNDQNKPRCEIIGFNTKRIEGLLLLLELTDGYNMETKLMQIKKNKSLKIDYLPKMENIATYKRSDDSLLKVL